MWLYLVAVVLIVAGIVGGVATGGIFTLVLVPLGVIVLVSAVVSAMWGRAAQKGAGGATDASRSTEHPLPHNRSRGSGRAPTSPEALADARRAQQ